ncbi:hypothetical protein Salat_2435300 [Sesamum alatum]|uniref:Uncharacterized protein n=1 Tax=Sesamum alatum TaxID=300844 RepID=A0AAE1XZA3_9LAMI|nr:hypothetical protein Salat_2435300 [Sesamum alatum]
MRVPASTGSSKTSFENTRPRSTSILGLILAFRSATSCRKVSNPRLFEELGSSDTLSARGARLLPTGVLIYSLHFHRFSSDKIPRPSPSILCRLDGSLRTSFECFF